MSTPPERRIPLKKCFTLAAVLVAGLMLCLVAKAYYPHLTVRECPHCRLHIVQEETLSGNTFEGAVYYSDGKMLAQGLPDHPWLVKCPGCKGLFWVDEALKVDSGFDAAKGLTSVMWPSEIDLLSFISSSTPNGEKEIYLRICAWRTANDGWRHLPNENARFSQEQQNNMRALLKLFDSYNENQRLLKAEIARELGDFKTCKNLLTYAFTDEFNYAASIIKKLAEEGDSRVREIYSSNSPKYTPKSYPGSSRKSRKITE
jgi:hypothetical protein